MKAPPLWNSIKPQSCLPHLLHEFVPDGVPEVSRSFVASFDRRYRHPSRMSSTPFHCHFQADAGLVDDAYRPWSSPYLVDQFRSKSFAVEPTARFAHQHQITLLHLDPSCRALNLFVSFLTRSLSSCVPDCWTLPDVTKSLMLSLHNVVQSFVLDPSAYLGD